VCDNSKCVIMDGHRQDFSYFCFDIQEIRKRFPNPTGIPYKDFKASFVAYHIKNTYADTSLIAFTIFTFLQ